MRTNARFEIHAVEDNALFSLNNEKKILKKIIENIVENPTKSEKCYIIMRASCNL